jgi:quercetin dioxygenase-like cupin family protein
MAQDVIHRHEGKRFELTGDVFTIKQESVDGSPSLTHLIVAPGGSAPCHTHERYTETFYIIDGELEFTFGQTTFVAKAGDFISAPPMARHGYANRSGKPVEMLFGFSPGGMEEFFYKHRTDGRPFDLKRYLDEARTVRGTIYEAS